MSRAGGGSKEDLWVFNSERIARAAYACHKPVVSAVGHEIDYTILDYVADVRAPTPSAAAELCVPDKRQFLQEIYNLEQNIQKNIQSRLQMCYNRVNALGAGAALQAFHGSLEARAQQVDRYAAAASGAAAAAAAAREQALRNAAALAASLDPYAVLARGYAMVRDGAGNCRTVDTLRPGQNITLCGAAAQAVCTVQNVTKTQGDNANENAENL